MHCEACTIAEELELLLLVQNYVLKLKPVLHTICCASSSCPDSTMGCKPEIAFRMSQEPDSSDIVAVKP